MLGGGLSGENLSSLVVEVVWTEGKDDSTVLV